MANETFGKTEEIKKVQQDGKKVPPASDAEAHESATDIDISNGVAEEIVGPSRCQQLFVHVEPDAAAHIEVRFLDSEGGDVITSRTPGENSGLESTGGGDIFGRVRVLPSRFMEVLITDDSGGANTADYQFRVV
jgi:hypothetical protein